MRRASALILTFGARRAPRRVHLRGCARSSILNLSPSPLLRAARARARLGLSPRVWGFGSRALGFGLGASRFGFAPRVGFGASGSRFRAWGLGFGPAAQAWGFRAAGPSASPCGFRFVARAWGLGSASPGFASSEAWGCGLATSRVAVSFASCPPSRRRRRHARYSRFAPSANAKFFFK